MEIHLGFCAYRMRPLFKLWYFKSGSTNQHASFFPWKFGLLSFIWLWFHVNIQISLGMAAIWKKSFWKVEFFCCADWAKVVNFQHFQPLNSQKTKGYDWKNNVHIFHLILGSTMFDHWFSHRDLCHTGPLLYKNFPLQRVDGFPCVDASMPYLNQGFAIDAFFWQQWTVLISNRKPSECLFLMQWD